MAAFSVVDGTRRAIKKLLLSVGPDLVDVLTPEVVVPGQNSLLKAMHKHWRLRASYSSSSAPSVPQEMLLASDSHLLVVDEQ